ncbi:MAG: cytochrome c-type biogenesis protein [Pseudomonadota bacterium]
MRRYLSVIAICVASAAAAVEPGEVLDDPALEARAREISQGLRCTVCQNESIDESSAPVARDLRLLVRERLVAGDSDAEVMDFIVARYGEFVLLRPSTEGANLLLWLLGPAALVLAVGGVLIGRRRGAAEAPLSAEEEAALAALLAEDGDTKNK